MASSERKHHRQSIRLPAYDYTQAGAYFVTLCTHRRELLFGQVIDQALVLNACGRIAQEEWLASEAIRHEIELDSFVIMPNHLHGIVWIVQKTNVGATGWSPARRNQPSLQQGHSPTRQSQPPLQDKPQRPVPKSLGAFIGGYKSAATKRINQTRGTPGLPVWQRNYWEHIIRTERALNAIREYIEDNPACWALDTYNPLSTKRDPRAVDLWRLLQEP